MRTKLAVLAQLAVMAAGLVTATVAGGPPAAPVGGSAAIALAGAGSGASPPAAVAPEPARTARVAAPAARTAPVATVKPRALPAAGHHPAAAPALRRTALATGASRPRPAHATGAAFRRALDVAVSRIPSYSSGAARWVVSTAWDYWGTTDWYQAVIYINPDVPLDKLYDVAVHEWSHELSVLDYAGNVDAAVAAMNRTFGGTGATGAERAADCMAILQGARWTHYTSCTSAAWRTAAARLVAGHRL